MLCNYCRFAYCPFTWSTSRRSIAGIARTTICRVLRIRSSNSTIFPFFRLAMVSLVVMPDREQFQSRLRLFTLNSSDDLVG